jgi:hypothetical protein
MSIPSRTLATLALLSTLAAESRAAVFTPSYPDPADRGFLDPTPVPPVGGNPGTTVGQQRRLVLERALAIFAARLQSDQPVRVLATFNGDDLACTATAAVLGGAAADHAIRYAGPAGSPHPTPGVLYHAALADSFAGGDAAPGEPDVVAHFNGRIGTPGCGDDMRWYYGFDGQAPAGAVDLFTVVLHELAHALGFSDFTDRTTGEFARDQNGTEMPGAFALFLYDNPSGKRWPALTPEQRLVSRQNNGNLLWDGPAARAVSASLPAACIGGGSRMRMFAPAAFAPGSSVSHWDTTCSPDLLMEPMYTGRGFLDLTPVLLSDLGWKLAGTCGDGTADDGEQCDRGGSNGGGACTAVCTGSGSGGCGDGIIGTGEQCDQGAQNGTAGSCCSASCALKPAATACRTGGECDMPVVCTGQSPHCPAGAATRKPDGSLCTGGVCLAGSCLPASSFDGGALPDAATPDATPSDAASPPDVLPPAPDAAPTRPMDARSPDAPVANSADAAPADGAPAAMPDPDQAAGCSCDAVGGARNLRVVRARALLLLLALMLICRRRRAHGRRP